MPNYISKYDDWYPAADDPDKFKAQVQNLKGLSVNHTFTAFIAVFNNEESGCTKNKWPEKFGKFKHFNEVGG